MMLRTTGLEKYGKSLIPYKHLNSNQKVSPLVLSPAEQYPLGYYQDQCWHSHPRFLIQPQVFNFSHPRLLFCPRFSFFATLGYYSTLGFLFFLPQATFLPQVFSFCHPNSPLGFLFFPPQATIPPQVFSFSHPRLLSRPRFSLFPHPRLLSCPRLVFGREEYTPLKGNSKGPGVQ